MSSTATIGAFVCSFVVTVSCFQERGWRGLVPLHSTRADVERQLTDEIAERGTMLPAGMEKLKTSERAIDHQTCSLASSCYLSAHSQRAK